MITNLDDIQTGLTELAAAIFDGDTATCKVKAEDDFSEAFTTGKCIWKNSLLITSDEIVTKSNIKKYYGN